MKNNKTTALLMLLVFLLVAAVVIIFLTGLDSSSRRNSFNNVTTIGDSSVNVETPAPTPTPTPVTTAIPSAAPTYYPSSTYTPSGTARPVSTATPPPTATPKPTATPTPSSSGIPMVPIDELIPATPTPAGSGENGSTTLVPTGTSLGSGSFRSDSGASINIHADWSAVVSGDRTVDVTVTVYCDSYSLFTTASPEALNIGLDGQYLSLASPTIEYDGTAQISTLINSHTFSVNLGAGESRSIPLEVSWLYRGTYGGVQIETIDCGGNISLSR